MPPRPLPRDLRALLEPAPASGPWAWLQAVPALAALARRWRRSPGEDAVGEAALLALLPEPVRQHALRWKAGDDQGVIELATAVRLGAFWLASHHGAAAVPASRHSSSPAHLRA